MFSFLFLKISHSFSGFLYNKYFLYLLKLTFDLSSRLSNKYYVETQRSWKYTELSEVPRILFIAILLFQLTNAITQITSYHEYIIICNLSKILLQESANMI